MARLTVNAQAGGHASGKAAADFQSRVAEPVPDGGGGLPQDHAVLAGESVP